jgi:hypothetical protein
MGPTVAEVLLTAGLAPWVPGVATRTAALDPLPA